jgi:hypothetical protein
MSTPDTDPTKEVPQPEGAAELRETKPAPADAEAPQGHLEEVTAAAEPEVTAAAEPEVTAAEG